MGQGNQCDSEWQSNDRLAATYQYIPVRQRLATNAASSKDIVSYRQRLAIPARVTTALVTINNCGCIAHL